MSLDNSILKNLLKNLLESRIQKLEKRSNEQFIDLKYIKSQYKKQAESLNKITLKKPIKKYFPKLYSRKKTFDKIIYNKPLIKKDKRKKEDKYLKISMINNNLRKAITPITPKRRKKNIFLINNSILNAPIKKQLYPIKRRIYITPEPKLKKKKKRINKNITNIVPKKLNLPSNNINIIKNDINKNKRNINSIRREENKIKNTIVSNIGLDTEQINFVLEEFKKQEKEKEEMDSNNDDSENNDTNNKIKTINLDSSNCNSSGSSSSWNKNKQTYKIKDIDIIKKFWKYLISSDGNKIIRTLTLFLDKKSKINFFSISKKIIIHLAYYIDSLRQNILDINKINLSNPIEVQINNIKKRYKKNELEFPFTLSKGSTKALDLLNSDKYNYIFKIQNLEPPKDKIILIYRIFFQLIDKEELIEIENDKNFWEKTRNYILENNKGKTGTFFKEYISEFDFTNKNIFKIKKLINGKEDEIKPIIYEKICKTTGLIVFIIKDSLEYCGVIQNDKKYMPNIVINYLQYIKDNLNYVEEYIDKIKNLNDVE